MLENHTLLSSWKLKLTKSLGESKNDFGDCDQCNKLALKGKKRLLCRIQVHCHKVRRSRFTSTADLTK